MGRRSTTGSAGIALYAAVGALLLAAGIAADRATRHGEAVLGSAEPTLEALVSIGGVLAETAAPLLRWLRLPVLLGVGAGLVLLGRRVGGRAEAARIGLALAVAGVAQSFLLDGRVAWGLALYAGSAAIALHFRAPAAAPLPHWSAARESAALLAGFGLFVAFALIGIDVFPDLRLDEQAYLIAARMQLGELARGDMLPPPLRGMYAFERFQAQLVPLGLQSAGVALMGPGVVPIRTVSLALSGLALLGVARALASRLGSATGVWGVALAATAPLTLSVARQGEYLACSVLHGALTFAALLRLAERPRRREAALLGGLLGSVVALYQVSWFVPLLAALGAAALPELWRRRDAIRLGAVVVATAAAVALPTLFLFRDGLRLVASQSFDERAVWQTPEAGPWASALVASELPPANRRIRGFLQRAHGAGVRGIAVSSDRYPVALYLGGPAAAIRPLLDRYHWGPVLVDDTRAPGIAGNVQRMLATLFAAPGWEALLRLVRAPLLNPAIAALLVLGLVEAARHWRLPAQRLLLVWVVGGGLLPAALASPLPRRTVLALPFLYAVAALPLVSLARAAGDLDARRRLALAGIGALALLVATDAHLYFRRWHLDFTLWPGFEKALASLDAVDMEAVPDAPPARPHRLALARTLRRLPADEPVLLPPLFPRLGPYLRRVEEEPAPGEKRRVFVLSEATSPASFADLSCRFRPPFSWVVPAGDDLSPLGARFAYDVSERDGYRVLRVTARRPGACPRDSG